MRTYIKRLKARAKNCPHEVVNGHIFVYLSKSKEVKVDEFIEEQRSQRDLVLNYSKNSSRAYGEEGQFFCKIFYDGRSTECYAFVQSWDSFFENL